VAVDALRAGIDLLYVPDPSQQRRVYDAVVAAARSGRIPAARLQEAAARVLELKRAAS
jgi:beta-N-acetylhexosaminidase